MSDTPWITEQWFSSPWNYLGDATGKLNLPSSLKVHDVTLRDGEQQAGARDSRGGQSEVSPRKGPALQRRVP